MKNSAVFSRPVTSPAPGRILAHPAKRLLRPLMAWTPELGLRRREKCPAPILGFAGIPEVTVVGLAQGSLGQFYLSGDSDD